MFLFKIDLYFGSQKRSLLISKQKYVGLHLKSEQKSAIIVVCYRLLIKKLVN